MKSWGVVRIWLLVAFLVAGAIVPATIVSQEPADGPTHTVMLVTVRITQRAQASDRVVVESVQVMQGRLPRSAAVDAQSAAALPELVILNERNRVLHRAPFHYPRYVTVPPLPPGVAPDGQDGVVPLEDSTVGLVVPCVEGADGIGLATPESRVPSLMRRFTAEERLAVESARCPAPTAAPAPAKQGTFNLLLIASGYRTSQMTRFRTAAANVKNTILGAQPFAAQKAKIAIRTFENTAGLGCAPGCAGIGRLMCCNNAKVIEAAVRSRQLFDEIIVIHNTRTYSGGGYMDMGYYKTNSYTTTSQVYDGQWTARVGLHEFGHSFGSLCDEYQYGGREGPENQGCVNCRASCAVFGSLAKACITGCASRRNYKRPEPSIMLSLDKGFFNGPSLKSTYAPEGLVRRLNFFIRKP